MAESAGMTLRLWVLLIVALTVVLLVGAALSFLLIYEVGEFLKEDRCLDRGGRWHADQSVCEYLPKWTWSPRLLEANLARVKVPSEFPRTTTLKSFEK